VNQITQRNAAAAEELSSTAEELSAQAASLERQVAWFRVDEAGPRPASSRAHLLAPAAARGRAA
jgi:methyl-accepting chemotaxis protein